MDYTGETENQTYPGFYHVPGFEHIVIRLDGKIIDTEKNFCPFPQIWGGYPAISVGGGASAHVHRLLALTFLPDPDLPIEELEVNHIDGVKTNNAIANLEWVTWSENIAHAYQTGLRSDNRPVLAKDLRTEKIDRYYSLQECARRFGLDGSLLHVYLRAYNRGKISCKYYVFIYEGDDWPPLTKDDIGTYRNGTAKPIMATCQRTGSSIIFESAGEAAKQFGHKRATLAMHLYRNGAKPFHGQVFRYLDDPSLVEESKGRDVLLSESPAR